MNPDGQVMVPGVDLADHNPYPSCSVTEDVTKESFLLVASKKIQKGEALTINYGPLSSDELLSDYGFTVDNNPNDKMTINCDYDLLHLVRLVMGQTEMHDEGGLFSPLHQSGATAADSHTIHSTIGRGVGGSVSGSGSGQKLDDRWLHQWQVYWLSALNLYGPTAQYSTSKSIFIVFHIKCHIQHDRPWHTIYLIAVNVPCAEYTQERHNASSNELHAMS